MTDSGAGINSIITKADASLLYTSNQQYRPRMSNFWLLPAITWAGALAKSGHIDHPIVIVNAQKFNTAMSKST